MTTSTTAIALRAHVYRDRRTAFWVIDVDDPQGDSTWTAFELSWAEAMQRAYTILHQLDRLLMDQVHASRAARRIGRTADPHTMEATA